MTVEIHNFINRFVRDPLESGKTFASQLVTVTKNNCNRTCLKH